MNRISDDGATVNNQTIITDNLAMLKSSLSVMMSPVVMEIVPTVSNTSHLPGSY